MPPEQPVQQPVIADGRPILTPAEAKKRFLLYFAVKMAGLAALFGGVFIGQGALTPASALLLVIGLAALFVRPRHLGLTPKKP
jgi:hypothetical protein